MACRSQQTNPQLQPRVTIRRGKFDGNRAGGGKGSILSVGDGGSLLAVRCAVEVVKHASHAVAGYFSRSEAARHGGAVYVRQGSLSLNFTRS